jgi:hypothetical protein
LKNFHFELLLIFGTKMEFKDVKIVKNCKEVKEVPKEVEEKCRSFNFEGQDFLKTVHKDILYFDDSIKIPGRKTVKTSKEPEKVQVPNAWSEPECPEENQKSPRKTPPACFDEVPRKLHEQMSLPITNIQDLSFYETFIISQKESNSRLSDIEPETDIDNTNEIGSACLMIEELSDGNILIFSIQQMFINSERTIHESLSVVTKDLKLVHEKRIERKCSDSEFMVCSCSIMIEVVVEGWE